MTQEECVMGLEMVHIKDQVLFKSHWAIVKVFKQGSGRIIIGR